MTPQQKDFLYRAYLAAKTAGHIFPEMAACEAALESGYGRSQLAVQDRNLFGMKQHQHPVYGTHVLPTKEFVGIDQDSKDGMRDGWVGIDAKWVSYPSWETCFADRMATLQRLASVYPHYAHALAAGSATTYINEVSRKWSTDPLRAEKVLAIYDNISGDWSATENA